MKSPSQDMDLRYDEDSNVATPSRTPRWAKATALVVSLCLILGVAWSASLGHAAGGLADFRRWDMKAGTVELVGASKAVDDFVCFLDTYEAALRLMLMILVFRGTATACAPATASLTVASRNSCQNSFFTGWRQFLFMISFIAQAISDCLGTLVVPAACTAGITGLFATLTNIPTGVFAVMNGCEHWYHHEKVTPYGVSVETLRDSRRLGALPWPTPAPTADPYPSQLASYGSAIAVCVNIVGQLAHYVMRGFLVFIGASKTCAPANQNTEKGKKKCAISMITVFTLLSVYAQFTAVAMQQCRGWNAGDQMMVDAQCTQGCVSFSTAVGAATAVSLKMNGLCPSWLATSTLPPEPTPVPINHWLTTSAEP